MIKPLKAPAPVLAPRSRTASSLDLVVEPPQAGEAKQAWVYRQIRTRILQGVLAARTRLPSTRSLAQRWQVSRTTVELAYGQLASEGYLVGAVGSGTYVAAVIPDRFLGAAGPAGPQALGPDAKAVSAALAAGPADAAGKDRVGLSFTARMADATLFPMDSWRRLLVSSARRATAAELAHHDPLGWWPLREQISRYLGAARGLACRPEQVVVLSGIRDGLDLAGRVLLTAADKMLVEDPGYLNAVPIFGRYARSVLPVPVDDQGFSVARARRYRGVKLVHLTPARQSPLGSVMPVSRRLELLDWAAQTGCWLVEDDYDSEFNFEAAPLPALKSLDAADRVVHCGSFNKTLFGALRIGYAVLPLQQLPAFAQACRSTGRGVGVVEQMALAAFIGSGAFARHVRRARAVYAQRRDRLVQALHDAVGAGHLHISGAQAGFHLLWWPPPQVDVPALIAIAARKQLGFELLSDFCRKVKLPDGLVLGYSGLQDDALERHCAALVEAIRLATRAPSRKK